MRHLLPKLSIAVLGLVLLFQLVAQIGPGAALAQPPRPTLTAAPPRPPTATRKPDRDPTETPVPTATELPTATAMPTEPPADPATPTATAAPVPAQLPTTGAGSADQSAALLLGLLVLGVGVLLRPRRR
jgi:MYXO-CTERM domain-containing protein